MENTLWWVKAYFKPKNFMFIKHSLKQNFFSKAEIILKQKITINLSFKCFVNLLVYKLSLPKVNTSLV